MSEPFSFTALQIFAELAATGSFSETARRLGLSQSAVSQTLHRLEAQLGVRLMDRAVRPAVATLQGRDFLAAASQLLEAKKKFNRAVDDMHADKPLSLRFGITEVAQGYAGVDIEAALIGLVNHFKAVSGLIPRMHELFNQDELDVVVAPDIQEDNRLLAFELLTENYLIICPKGMGPRVDEVPMETLKTFLTGPFVSYGCRSLDWRKSQRMLRILGVECNGTLTLENTSAVVEAVVNGIGWTIVPPMNLWSVRDRLDAVTVHGMDVLSAEKTLYCAARSLRYRYLAQRASEVFLTRFKEQYLTEITRHKTCLSKYLKAADSWEFGSLA